MDKKFNKELTKISSEIFIKESFNLSFLTSEIIERVLSLRVIEADDFEIETLEKYRYFDNFFILKIKQNHYLINTTFIDVYYKLTDPILLNDYKVFQRKDKLKKIQKNIEQKD
jgi:DUF4097 and DUF4098 domain-containing protein YvlB